MIYFASKQLSDTKVRNLNFTGLAAPVNDELSTRFLFMRQLTVNKKVIYILGFALSLLLFENAWADFGISATPYEGGFDLRFGKIAAAVAEVKKEITLKVTTDQGKKYRVFQELIVPLANTEGQTIPYANLTFYTLQGSNSYGSLTTTQQLDMHRGRMLLYTSNSSGQGDSFVLVYGLTLPEDLPSGTYRGRFRFILETTDSSVAAQQINLNAVVTLESQAALEVITPLGGKTIELRAGVLAQEKNEILFKITGNFGQTYRLTQFLPEPLRAEARELPRGSVIFKVSEGRKGIMAPQDELHSGNTVLYTSNPRGEGDNILVSYQLAEPLEVKAGSYRGRIRFLMESAAPLKGIEEPTLDFLVNIEPTFELTVSPETGGRIEFRDLKAEQQPQVNEVVVEVATNLGKPYQLSQKVENLLTSKEGKTISQENFVFYEEKITEGGVLKQPSRVPVEVGETTLFVSDEKGSTAKFKIIYELTIPRDLTAGNYSSQITYSISEL